MKIKSRQDAVVLMMNELGVTVPQATEIFVKLVDAKSAKRPELLKQIREVEAMGVSAYNKLLRKVSNSFVTPFDREDLFRLGDALDDVIDEIEGTAEKIVLLELPVLPDGFAENAAELIPMAQATHDALALLKKPKQLAKCHTDFYEHESKMDANYRKMLANSLVTGRDPIVVIREKVLLDAVERIATDMDHFMRALASIAIKET